MELKQLTGRIFYIPHEPERDRPMLAYLRGSKFSLAIDAGYSSEHVDSFYAALEQAGLRPPDFTAVTHWHYDHTFGLHRISGISIAYERTNEFLREQQRNASDPGYFDLLKQADIHFAREYRNLPAPRIVPADLSFRERLVLDLGGLTAQLFHAEAPHSEDTVCIYVPEERVLFLGDATSEDFFNGSPMDQNKLRQLVRMIEGTPCMFCVLSHAEPLSKDALLAYLYTILE